MIQHECVNCHQKFTANKYHPDDQHYCGKRECRRASACASRKKWRNAQAENDPTYWAREVKRVSESRARKKRREAALRGLDPRVVVAYLREQVRRLEMFIKGLAAFFGGSAMGLEELDAFLERCAENVRKLGGLSVTGQEAT